MSMLQFKLVITAIILATALHQRYLYVHTLASLLAAKVLSMHDIIYNLTLYINVNTIRYYTPIIIGNNTLINSLIFFHNYTKSQIW